MSRRLAFAAAVLLALGSGAALATHAVPANVAAALADPGRSDDDRKADAERKPAEMINFAGIKPGSRVMDIMPGPGYFTRIFAKVVGAKGYVYAFVPTEINAALAKRFPGLDIKKQFAAYDNVSVINLPIEKLTAPEALDVAWISLNYHDLHNKMIGPADMAVVNKAVYDALRPGGVYIVLDHSAARGAGTSVTDTLHRIDEDAVKKEVEAAGFRFAGENNALRNPEDPRDKIVFDPSIRHHTDQFVLKFVKPKH